MKSLILLLVVNISYAQLSKKSMKKKRKSKYLINTPIQVKMGLEQSSNVDNVINNKNDSDQLFKLSLSNDQKIKMPYKSVLKISNSASASFAKEQDEIRRISINTNAVALKLFAKKWKVGLRTNLGYSEDTPYSFNFATNRAEILPHRSVKFGLGTIGSIKVNKKFSLLYNVDADLTDELEDNFFINNEENDNLKFNYGINTSWKLSKFITLKTPVSYVRTLYRERAALAKNGNFNTRLIDPVDHTTQTFGLALDIAQKKIGKLSLGANQSLRKDSNFGASSYEGFSFNISGKLNLTKSSYVEVSENLERKSFENAKVYDENFVSTDESLKRNSRNLGVSLGLKNVSKLKMNVIIKYRDARVQSNRFDQRYKDQNVSISTSFKI